LSIRAGGAHIAKALIAAEIGFLNGRKDQIRIGGNVIGSVRYVIDGDLE